MIYSTILYFTPFVMRPCNERTTLHCVESYLYYIILAQKKIIFGGVERGKNN
jgi:hypothetical protein